MKIFGNNSTQKVFVSITKILSGIFFYSTYLLATVLNFSFIAYLVFDDKTSKNTFWENGFSLTLLLFFSIYGIYSIFGKKLEKYFKKISKGENSKFQIILDVYVLLSFFGYLSLLYTQHFSASPWMQDVVSTLETMTHVTSVATLSFIFIVLIYILLSLYLISFLKNNTLKFIGATILFIFYSTFVEIVTSVLLERYAVLQTIFGVSVLYLYFNYTRHRYVQYSHARKKVTYINVVG